MDKYDDLIYNYIISSLDSGLGMNENVVKLPIAKKVLTHLGLLNSPNEKELTRQVNNLVEKHIKKFSIPFKFDKDSNSWELLVGGTKVDYFLFKFVPSLMF